MIVAAAGPLLVRSIPAHPSNYNAARRRVPTLIVIHATHGVEGVNADRNGALEITKPNKGRSWHYMVDADSVTRSVPDEARAWHCGAHGNAMGLGVELCGRADQTAAQWYDRVSLATMQIAARLCADLCLQWSIPPVLVTQSELVAGRPGITTHACVSAAWHESTHTDPGPAFPMHAFVAAVAKATVVIGPLGDV